MSNNNNTNNNNLNLEELGLKYIEQRKKQYNYSKKYTKHKYHTDNTFKRKTILRTKLSNILSTYNKNPITQKLEYTTKQLIQHIEKQFTNEMTWENYGTYWELDHIRPLKTASCEEDVYKLFALSNLRPLTKKCNRVCNYL